MNVKNVGSNLFRKEVAFFLLGFGVASVYFLVLQKSGIGNTLSSIRDESQTPETVVPESTGNSGVDEPNTTTDQTEETTDSTTTTQIGDDSADLSMLKTGLPSCSSGRTEKAESAFMFMVSHSGTTGLITELISHPDMGNFTNTMDLEPLQKCKADVECEQKMTSDVMEAGKEAGKIGILKYNGRSIYDNMDTWKDFITELAPRPILMYRPNVFKRSVGRYPFYYLDYQAHFGGLRPGEEDRCAQGDLCSFSVDPKNVVCEMKRARNINQKLKDAVEQMVGSCYLEILYEDYLYHPVETMYLVEDYLGIPRGGTEVGRIKATSDNMCEVIENYAEVCAAFNDCQAWHWMINDEENGCLCSNYEYESLGGDIRDGLKENPFCALTQLPGERPYCVAELRENA